MTNPSRLGGFKVLKDALRIALVSPKGADHMPLHICRIIADHKINLPYLTIVSFQRVWGIDLVVDVSDGERTTRLIGEHFREVEFARSRSVVISIFPHKRNPEISGRLLFTFAEHGLEPDGLASSPSAISVVIQEDLLQRASKALFEPFSFGPYRTAEDWKMAQKGKERIFKEVVASYQEKKPGVYGLEHGIGQELVQVGLEKAKIAQVGSSFKSLDCYGLRLAFLATSPCPDPLKGTLSFCLPSSEGSGCKRAISRLAPRLLVDTVSPVMSFSMHGPHFGDRYGITSRLLTTMNDLGVAPLALSCTVASITGVVLQEQSDATIRAIRTCFDVPTVTKKE